MTDLVPITSLSDEVAKYRPDAANASRLNCRR